MSDSQIEPDNILQLLCVIMFHFQERVIEQIETGKRSMHTDIRELKAENERLRDRQDVLIHDVEGNLYFVI